MRKFNTIAILITIMAVAVPASRASKIDGTTTLKDSQPTEAMDNGQKHRHQSYDLTFDASGREYTCRTDPQKSMNATDFVVGNEVSYQIDGTKAKIKTPQGKKVECKIVRVANIGSPQ
ncbi:MAG: hypothetical protein WA419_14895 [Silvibacterium sp.]